MGYSVAPGDVRLWTNIAAPDWVVLPLVESCANALADSWPAYRGPGGFMSAEYVDGIADSWHVEHEPVWSLDDSDSNRVVAAIGANNVRAAMAERGDMAEGLGLAEFAAYELTGAVAHAFRLACQDED